GTSDGRPVFDALASLVEKSLVVADAERPAARYRLLEATRAFALEKLDAAGERENVVRSHAHWVADFADRMVTTYQVEPRQQWMAIVAPELGNARAALEWALGTGDDAVVAGRIDGGLAGLWRIAGLEVERRRWVTAVLARLDTEAHPAIAARLLRALTGSLNGTARIAAAQRALELCSKIDDRLGIAGCHTGLAVGLLQT